MSSPHTSTRIFAVLGNPVVHSLSPRFQNAGFHAAGLRAAYIPLQVDEADLASVMRTLCATGGGGNITVPWKRTVASLGTMADTRVARLGAANVFGSVDGEMVLANTDVDGVLVAIGALGVESGAWHVIGTGGTARAIVGAAIESGVSICVTSRDPARAAQFNEWVEAIGGRLATREECTIVLNATPLGLNDSDPDPIALTALAGVRGVVDMTYSRSGTTGWVRRCRAAGLAAVDGRIALLAQGVASWRTWFPGVVPPIDVMRAALDGTLG